MNSKSNTSTLFSTYKASKISRGYSRNGSTSTNRYIVGSVGKSCGKHSKLSSSANSSSSSGSGQCHKNVAIATQVLNPRDIGGSPKNRRFIERPKNDYDDDISFFNSRKRRSRMWSKACYYGISIGVTIVMITGLIVAVGYMQSEKKRILTRPVKLAQGQLFEASTTQVPPVQTLQGTTFRPRNSRDSINEINVDEDEEIDEIGIHDYSPDRESLDNLHDIDENSIIEDYKSKSPEITDNQDDNDYQNDENDSNTASENESETTAEDQDRFPSEIRVRPPSDFKFEGISFQIPIYRPKFIKNKDEESQNSTSFTSNVTKIDENGANQISQASNSNFTSLIESEENNNNANGDDDDEKYLSTFKTTTEHYSANENYANTNNIVKLKEELNSSENALSSISNELSKDKDVEPSGDANYTAFSHQASNNNLSNSNENYTAIIKTNDISSNSRNEDFSNNDGKNPEFQTDIFDNDDFQTSATEESGVDMDLDSIMHPSNNPYYNNRPSTNRQKSNNYYGPRNPNRNQNLSFRRGKILRTRPIKPVISDVDYDEEPRQHIQPNNKGHKKLFMRPHKKLFQMTVKSNSYNSERDQEEEEPITTSSKNDKNDKPTSIVMPILEYKVDFSKYIPSSSSSTPAPSPSPEPYNNETDENNKIEYQPPVFNKSPYPDFKFATPSSSDADKPFNLDEYLAKHVNKELITTTISPHTQTFYQTTPIIQHYNTAAEPTTTTTTTSIGSFSSTGLSPQQDSNQFSKRTFYNLDYFGNTNENPFAHLLGSQQQQATTSNAGVFGLPTPTGATLNIFNPQKSYNFDTSSTSSSNLSPYNFQSNLLPPLNLNSFSSSPQQSFTIDANGHFSLTNPGPSSNLPYPNIPTTGDLTNYLGSNYQNAFSFSNNNNNDISSSSSGSYGSESSKVPILTTGQGQVPTYNTITQGIHLLSLLSGKTPDHLNSHNNDQLASGSSLFPEFNSKPELQIAGLTGYGGSSTNFLKGLENNWGTTNLAPQNFFSQPKSFNPFSSNNNQDQDSSASVSIPSFRQSIVEKASTSFKSLKALDQLKIKTGNSTKSKEPQSLSIKILPNVNVPKTTRPTTTSFDNNSSLELESLAPKSRKRPLSKSDLDVQESQITPTTVNRESHKKTTVVGGQKGARGLKSGFFS